jgi:uncharacterized protein YukE
LCRGLEAAAKKEQPLQGAKELLSYLSVQHGVKPTDDELAVALDCVGLEVSDVVTVTQAELVRLIDGLSKDVEELKRVWQRQANKTEVANVKKGVGELRNNAKVMHAEAMEARQELQSLKKEFGSLHNQVLDLRNRINEDVMPVLEKQQNDSRTD